MADLAEEDAAAAPDQDSQPGGRGKQDETGALLRLVAVLGLAVVLGIGGFFLVGLLLDREFGLRGGGVIFGLVCGVALSVLWAYRAIARHLERFAADPRRAGEDK